MREGHFRPKYYAYSEEIFAPRIKIVSINIGRNFSLLSIKFLPSKYNIMENGRKYVYSISLIGQYSTDLNCFIPCLLNILFNERMKYFLPKIDL